MVILIFNMKALFLVTGFLVGFSVFGQLKAEFSINESNDTVSKYFVDDLGELSGVQEFYYNSGTLKQKQFWKNGYLEDSILSYDELGNVIGFGLVKDNYLMYYGPDSLLRYEVGLVKNGLYDGLAKYYSKTGHLVKVINFDKGEESEAMTINFDSNGYPYKVDMESAQTEILSFESGQIEVSIFDENDYGLRLKYVEGELLRLDFLNKHGVNGFSFIYTDRVVSNHILYTSGTILHSENSNGLSKSFNFEGKGFKEIIQVENVLHISCDHGIYHAGMKR